MCVWGGGGYTALLAHHTHPRSTAPCCPGRRLAERLEAAGRVQPEVCVMAGGWKRFRREIDVVADEDLVADFTD